MKAALRRLCRESGGFTLVEVMVAATILLTGLAGTVTMLDNATTSTATTKAREGATALQRELVEATHAIPYDQLTPNGMAQRLKDDGALSDSAVTYPGWTVRRRNITYAISTGVCTVDDPRDGYGDHEAGQYCAGGTGTTSAAQCQDLLGVTGTVSGAAAAAASSITLGDCGVDVTGDGVVDGLVNAAASVCVGTCAAGGVDQNPADYKRVVTLITWDKGMGKRWSLQAATIANPGLSGAPRIDALTADQSTPITSSAVTGVSFNATTAMVPATWAWYVDGTMQTSLASALGSYAFTWSLGTPNAGGSAPGSGEVVDGSYNVGVRAFDAYGQAGSIKTKTMVLNRSIAYPPQRVRAGRSGSVVNLDWAANVERDIAGYRVYRAALPTGPWTQVLASTAQTRWQDPSPPSAEVSYKVVALDRDPANALREGAPSAIVTLPWPDLNHVPTTPATLVGAPSGGNVVLSWGASSDPDAGDSVDYYQVYRDGKLYADQYDRTPNGTVTTYTDTRTGGLQHTYYVSAVDTHLGESAVSNGTTR